MIPKNFQENETQQNTNNLRLQSLTDEELVISLISGKELIKNEFFAELYSRYHSKMVKYLYGFVYDLHLAEDLFQEAMIKLYKNLSRFQIDQKFSSWFYRIVTNIALTYIKKHKKRDSILAETNIDYAVTNIPDNKEDEPESLFLDDELWQNFSHIVEGLPEKFRAIFLLRFQNQESYRNISEIFNLSERTIKWRMKKATFLIKQKLKDDGYF